MSVIAHKFHRKGFISITGLIHPKKKVCKKKVVPVFLDSKTKDFFPTLEKTCSDGNRKPKRQQLLHSQPCLVLIDSFTLSHEAAAAIKTDCKELRTTASGSPHVTRKKTRKDGACGMQLETGRRYPTRHHEVSTKLAWRHILKTGNDRIWKLPLG